MSNVDQNIFSKSDINMVLFGCTGGSLYFMLSKNPVAFPLLAISGGILAFNNVDYITKEFVTMSSSNVGYTSASQAYSMSRNNQIGKLRSSRLSAHFTWGEAFTGQSDSVVSTASNTIFNNIATQANTMESVRQQCGNKSIMVTSWFRHQNSGYHPHGLATDFNVMGQSPSTTQKILANHQGGLGSYDRHTHVDSRGYVARWTGTSR